MADIVRWNPYDELTRLRDEFTKTLAPFWSGSGLFSGHTGAWGPSVDVKETDTHIEVSAEIPGMNPSDLDITVTDDSVIIKGEIKHEAATNKQGFHRVERHYGSFQRTIPFPVAVKHEQATAHYHQGILAISVPKAETLETKVTRLKIDDQRGQLQ